MRRAILMLSMASVLMGQGAGSALAKGEYSRTGIHVSLLGVFALPTWESQLNGQIMALTPGAPPAELGKSGGMDMRVGYRFHERVAAETGFDWIAASTIEQPGSAATEASSWMYYIDAKLYIMTDQIQPFILLGMGAYHLDYTIPGTPIPVDGTSFSPRFGGGVDYYIDWRWGLTAEVDYVIGTRQLVNLDRVNISFGAFYRF